jgi:hypothetical protein
MLAELAAFPLTLNALAKLRPIIAAGDGRIGLDGRLAQEVARVIAEHEATRVPQGRDNDRGTGP